MKIRLLLVALMAFILVVACRKTTPAPVVPPSRDADAEVPPLTFVDAAVVVDASPEAASPVRRAVRRGVNLSGAEFGTVPGKHGVDYTWDKTDAAADYFYARGFNHFRIPFRHERLQPKLLGPLDAIELARMKGRVAHATGLGATVMLEAHNSYRHGVGCMVSAKVDAKCKIVTPAEMSDFWIRVVKEFKDNPRVQINVTNEPHHMDTELVALIGETVRADLRADGFTGIIAIPGGGWAGAVHFAEAFEGTTPSSKALLAVKADAETVFDVHLYLDDNADGVGDCVEGPPAGRMVEYVDWLRKHGRRGTIGEIAGIDTPKCRAAISGALTYIHNDAADVIDSWAWWGAGAWSFSTIYPLSIGPVAAGAQEKPQLAWLAPFLDVPARAGKLDGGTAKP